LRGAREEDLRATVWNVWTRYRLPQVNSSQNQM